MNKKLYCVSDLKGTFEKILYVCVYYVHDDVSIILVYSQKQ